MKGEAKKIRDMILEATIEVMYYILLVTLLPVSFVFWLFNSMSLPGSIKLISISVMAVFFIPIDLLPQAWLEDLEEELSGDKETEVDGR